jgi:energy-coupling factor transport system permease/ATP-binding protein
VLADLDLTIEAGQRVGLTGPSGAGKSTLLRAVAGLLEVAGQGHLTGRVLVGEHEAGRVPGDVALLLQDPTAAIVAETVGRDVAFGPENLGVPRNMLWDVVRRVLAETAFPYDVGHLSRSLSGGESQRLALAGSLALRTRVLLLDEPTSMLDESAADAVRASIRAAVERRGSTLVVVEQHMSPWLDFADRLIVLDAQGSVVADGEPSEILAAQADSLAAGGVWVPGVALPDVSTFDPDLVAPLRTVPGVVVSARQVGVTIPFRSAGAGDAPGERRPPTVALDGVDARLRSGRTLAVSGASGAGKSTLLTVLAGLLRPTSGEVTAHVTIATRKGAAPWRWSSVDLASRLAWAPQIPEVSIVTTNVRDELLATGRAVGRDAAWLRRRVDGLLDALSLDRLASASPYHLSGGEQRRLMVAVALAHGPSGALFDEPTVGQDRLTWAAVLSALAGARSAGTAVGIATHDRSAVRAVADDTLTLVKPEKPNRVDA